MGKIIAKKIQGMSIWTKCGIVAAITLLVTVFLFHDGWYKPSGSYAAVTQLQPWVRVNAWHTRAGGNSWTTNTSNYMVTTAQTNRILVVGISSSLPTAAAQTCSVTYGGQAMTLAAGDGTTSSVQHTYLFYLKDNAVMDNTNRPLVYSLSGVGKSSVVYAAVFYGVDQATAIDYALNYNSGGTASATVGPFSTIMNITPGDRAVEVVNITRSTAGAGYVINPFATGWSSVAAWGTMQMMSYIAVDTTAGGTYSQHTASNAANLSSLAAMVLLAYDVTVPTISTFTAPASSTSWTISPISFTASDNEGVTGYMITTNATPPAPGDAGWLSSAPTSYTVGSDGTYTLYPWARDGRGNVSAVFGTPRSVDVDTNGPTVSSTTPANGATGVAVNSNITINFNENVDCATVNTTNVTINGGSLALSSCSGSTAVFTASGQAMGTTYTANVSTGVKDLAGNSAAASYPFSFTTEANSTSAGIATAVKSGNKAIMVSMPYIFDDNHTSSAKVEYKLSTDLTYTLWQDLPNSVSPYTTLITGLTAGSTYDVRMTYIDSTDGVIGNPATQTVSVALPLYNPMLHNSVNLQSTKWGSVAGSGGWGIPGGRYGEFTCSTCHVPGTTNISRIKLNITTPLSTIPGGPVKFTNKSMATFAFGVYSAAVGNSVNICEVCHSKTNYHKYGQTTIISHENLGRTKDCVLCHKHEVGFKSSGCVVCHAYVQRGSRAPVMSQFMGTGNSHHVQGSRITDQACYQCHWAANIDGTVNEQYHGGVLVPDAPIRLVIYVSTARPTIYTTNAGAANTALHYVANGTRASITSLNNHCLGCHSDNANNSTPFDDGKTPRAYAWDNSSVGARYNQTGTAAWSPVAATTGGNRVSKKANLTKAYSAHGNAANNQRGWTTIFSGTGDEWSTIAKDPAWTNLSGTGQVVCFDCHNSHGSDATNGSSSYDSATGVKGGGILKSITTNFGGYGITYSPQGGGNVATKDLYKDGAALCFDCHIKAMQGQNNLGRVWSSYGNQQIVIDYHDTPYFSSNTFNVVKRFPYKGLGAGGTNKGGHFGASRPLINTPAEQINNTCTPCHDPHGVSPTLGGNQQYSVPLLKGTWLTAPYPEDAAGFSATLTRGGGSQVTPANQGSSPAYWLDQNTFQANRPTASVQISANQPYAAWGTFNVSANTLQTYDASQFAGLCLRCHAKADIAPNAGGTAPTWRSMERVHNSVKGWYSTNSKNVNSQAHAFTCSKCHVPHNSRLPRLLVTNCLDWKHRGRVQSGGSVAATAGWNVAGNLTTSVTTGSGYGRFPSGGARYSGTTAGGASGGIPRNSGPLFFGVRNNNAGIATTIALGSLCHNQATSGGGGASYPGAMLWNSWSMW